MALTGTETFGTVVPGFVTDADGRLIVTAGEDGTEFGKVVPGFLTDADGRWAVSEVEDDPSWVAGFVRNVGGELLVTRDTDAANWVMGFLRAPNGALVVNSQPVANEWDGGFLRAENRALAVSGLTTTIVRHNLSPRPNAQASGWSQLIAAATDDGSGLDNGPYHPESGYDSYYLHVDGQNAVGVALVVMGGSTANRAVVEPQATYLVSVDLQVLQRPTGLNGLQAIFQFFNDAGTNLGSPLTLNIVGSPQGRITWRVKTIASATRLQVNVGCNGSLTGTQTVELSVADLMIEEEAEFVPIELGELSDNYKTKPDGPLTVADTGQPWRGFEAGVGGDDRILRNIDGALTNLITKPNGQSAGYKEAMLEGDITRVTGIFSFADDGGLASDGAYCVAGGPVPAELGNLNLGFHWVVSRTTWLFAVFEDGDFFQLGSGTFSPELEVETPLPVQLIRSGDAVFLQMPDGSARVIRDSRIESLEGPYFYQEIYANDADTATQVNILKTWASNKPTSPWAFPGVRFFPTPDQITDGTAAWDGTPSASPSTLTLEVPQP